MANTSFGTTKKDTPPTIYGYSLEFRLKEGGTDQYNALFNILQDEGLEFDLKILPLKRAARLFSDSPTPTCTFPASKNALIKSLPELKEVPIIYSDPVDQISLRIFTKTDTPKISNIKELHNKKVALWNGLDPEVFLKGTNAIVENTPNELVRVRMLNAGRIYAILGFMPDVALAAQQLNLTPPHFDEKLALFRDEGASIVCIESPQNTRLINKFNRILERLKRNGKLKRILGPHVEIEP